ncbi:uncharacterized protein LOC125372459 [Haliotis rufescens]|uniref:uncharacterized protein LOC125372459 n=1 Tax=Haliotis rufescens TaxID=6454 RepID=UPI00201EF4FC|nr:uncharacterized protein LOC125372459 [Haliotis rufescens]
MLIVLLIIQKFMKECPKESALLSMGIPILPIGLVTMVHQLAFGSFGFVAVFFVMLGAVNVLSKVMIQLALVHATGRSNLKLALPVLGCFEEMGGLIGNSIMAKFIQETSLANGGLYFAGVSLYLTGVGAIAAWGLMKRWPNLSDEAVENTGEE